LNVLNITHEITQRKTADCISSDYTTRNGRVWTKQLGYSAQQS